MMFQMYLEKTNMLRAIQVVRDFNTRKFSLILSLFLVGQIAVSLLFDLPNFVISRGDSRFYFSGASHTGELSSFERLYVGYIFLLHFSQIISNSGMLMVVIQSIFVIFGAYAIFSLAQEYGNTMAGWISVSFYLVAPMLSQWTRYILTESIFYSLIVIGLRLATLKVFWSHLPMIPVVLLLIVLRPNGIIIACAVLSIYVLIKFFRISTRISMIILIWSFCVLFGVLLLGGGGVSGDSVQSSIFEKTIEGNVIYGVTEMNVRMPQPDSINRSNLAYVKYILENPLANLKIGMLRVYWELKQIRPWYSTSLNLFLLVTMASFYSFSFVGLVRTWRKHLVKAIAILTLPSVVLISMTWAIWEGRFGWWFMVSWIPLFGIGMSAVVDMVYKRINPTVRVQLVEDDPSLPR